MNVAAFKNQYALVKDSRAAVFDYCRRIGDAAYVTPVEGKSIRDLTFTSRMFICTGW